MIAGIVNANSRSVEKAVSPMPTMRSTIMGYMRPLGLTKIVKTVTDFQTVETEIPIAANGTWQPFSFEQLSIRPEGERSWRWFMVHTTADVILLTDDLIVRYGTRYRVMMRGDYQDNAFVEYHVVNSYDAPGGGR